MFNFSQVSANILAVNWGPLSVLTTGIFIPGIKPLFLIAFLSTYRHLLLYSLILHDKSIIVLSNTSINDSWKKNWSVPAI
jgi:hypothetical protein